MAKWLKFPKIKIEGVIKDFFKMVAIMASAVAATIVLGL